MLVRLMQVLIAMLLAVPAMADPVRIQGGKIRGTTDAAGLQIYKGVPFAAPPTGTRRWRPPAPVRGWQGVRDATSFAPVCPQDQSNNARTGLAPFAMSEDCLYLNIWVPPHAKGAKLPVMIWVYGGGLQFGTTGNPATSGEALARHGVIVISVAHRLGALGFLAHPALSVEGGRRGSGNYGMLDLIAALQWTQRNIAAFGGDAGNVTVFGESSGAAVVSALAASPLAKGLLHRVICQSGGTFAPLRRSRSISEGGLLVLPLDFAEEKGSAFFDTLGVKTVAQARSLSPEQIIKGTGSVLSGQFWLVADRYSLFGDQYSLYEAGRFNDVPILIGFNADEGAPFVPTLAAAANYTADVKAGFGAFADEILAAYPAGTAAQTLRSARDLRRDSTFGWSSWTWARMKSKHGKAPAYLYYFNQQPPWPAGPQADWGAAHAAEIPYVFGTLQTKADMKWTRDDNELSERMMRYWTNFAKAGDPNAVDLPAWPEFSRRSTAMYLGNNPAPGPVPNLKRLEIFDRYYADIRRRHAAE